MRIKTVIVAALTGAVVATSAIAPATAAPRSDVTASAAIRSVTVQQSDIADLIKRARAAGADTSKLEALQGRPSAQLAGFDIQRTLIVFALRYGGALLSRIVASTNPEAAAQIVLHANLIADFIENAETIGKDLIVGLLTNVGVPAAIAGIVADVILTLLQG
jgi:hypothetical protein